jgi:hypothetical protein
VKPNASFKSLKEIKQADLVRFQMKMIQEMSENFQKEGKDTPV